MRKEMLLEKLMELDFISLDLGLFLNTHPNNIEAMKTYNEVITAADTLRTKYEELYGPLCSFRSYSPTPVQWQWKNNPWPWEKEANPSLSGKECV